MALSVVDAHVRERLIWLRQQQEDMTILLSQVSTACLHCEKTLQQVWKLLNTKKTFFFSKSKGNKLSVSASLLQDDCRVVLAKQEINCLLETLQKQQHQFTELADHVQLDAGIPVTFTKVRTISRQTVGEQHSQRAEEYVVLSGQQSPHRPKDGDPSRDSGTRRGGKDHHPF